MNEKTKDLYFECQKVLEKVTAELGKGVEYFYDNQCVMGTYVMSYVYLACIESILELAEKGEFGMNMIEKCKNLRQILQSSLIKINEIRAEIEDFKE
jgi:hypothetical protein